MFLRILFLLGLLGFALSNQPPGNRYYQNTNPNLNKNYEQYNQPQQYQQQSQQQHQQQQQQTHQQQYPHQQFQASPAAQGQFQNYPNQIEQQDSSNIESNPPSSHVYHPPHPSTFSTFSNNNFYPPQGNQQQPPQFYHQSGQGGGSFSYPPSSYHPFPPAHGFLSKVKSSIAAAGNAIASGIQNVGEVNLSSQYRDSSFPQYNRQFQEESHTSPSIFSKLKNYLGTNQQFDELNYAYKNREAYGYPQHPQQQHPQQQHPQQQQTQQLGQQPTPSDFPTETYSQVDSSSLKDPRLLLYSDSAVLILKPNEFYRKKREIEQAGPNHLQVFSSFEHVFTHFKDENGVKYPGSAELLENSGVLSTETVKQIQKLAEDFAQTDADYEAFQTMTESLQKIISSSGSLHMSTIPTIARELSSKLGLRQGWREALQHLVTTHTPSFLFSSGYGDLIAHILLYNGLRSTDPNTPASLPQNIRIISNFFRASPDGTVRGFSYPPVHERNKNATTAELAMSLPVPNRKHVLVFGSDEDDVSSITESLKKEDNISSDLKEVLSVGYLEMNEDLPHRLPNFLTSYDAVVIGDGGFDFPLSLLEDILGVKKEETSSFNSVKNIVGSRIGLVKRGLGHLFSPLDINNASPSSPFAPSSSTYPPSHIPQSPQQPPQSPPQSYTQYPNPSNQQFYPGQYTNPNQSNYNKMY